MSADRAAATGFRTEAKVRAALLRYRVLAWATGIGLLVLTLGVVVKYLFHGGDTIVAVMGPIHGFLYIVLLLTTFDLGTRVRWPWARVILTMLAGTVPFLSFYAERKNQLQVHHLLDRS